MSSVTKKPSKDQRLNTSIDTEFIYAHVLGIMASASDSVSFETLFSHQLDLRPTALSDENGDCNAHNHKINPQELQILPGTRGQQPPAVIILGACAVLWTVPWLVMLLI